LSVSVTLQFKVSKKVKDRVKKVAHAMWLTGRLNDDTMSEFCVNAVMEKLEREESRVDTKGIVKGSKV